MILLILLLHCDRVFYTHLHLLLDIKNKMAVSRVLQFCSREAAVTSLLLVRSYNINAQAQWSTRNIDIFYEIF